MRKGLSAVLLVALIGTVSCYTVRFNIGHKLEPKPVEKVSYSTEKYKLQASWLFWGIFPLQQPEIADSLKKTRQKGEVIDAELEAEFHVLDYIVSFITFGIWIPRTVYLKVYYIPYQKKVVPAQETQFPKKPQPESSTKPPMVPPTPQPDQGFGIENPSQSQAQPAEPLPTKPMVEQPAPPANTKAVNQAPKPQVEQKAQTQPSKENQKGTVKPAHKNEQKKSKKKPKKAKKSKKKSKKSKSRKTNTKRKK